RAVEAAELNAVRMALFQATGDPEIAAMELDHEVIRGGAATQTVVAKQHRQKLIDKAVAYLLNRGPEPLEEIEQVPDDATVKLLLEMAEGLEIPDADVEFKRDLLAFDWFPRATAWTAERPDAADEFHVIIIGAGFSGLVMGLQMQLLNIPYTILERRHELGGTWSRNTYPDARVDTLSATYCYSFEKRYPWSEYFARQGEVRSYLEHCARKYGMFDHIRFDHDLSTATFDEKASTWTLSVKTPEGLVDLTANVIVSASGLFAAPRTVNIEGAGSFGGELVHSIEWTASHTAEGKSVAVIGNGSTGVQLLAPVAAAAKNVHVFQRSPQWISPRERYGEPISPEARWLEENLPYFWHWNHYTAVMPLFTFYELLVPDPEWQESGGRFNRRNDGMAALLTGYIKNQVDNRQDLIDKLIPDYLPMARRPVVDNGWYRALVRDNVELVTDPIAKITETGIVTADGTERAVDMIIAAVGFDVNQYTWPAEYRGVGGKTLQDVWADKGPRAHLGMTVPGFPNLFIMYGPNSQPISGGGALPQWFEIWSRYIAKIIVAMLESGNSRAEVREEVYETYNERQDETARGLIYMVDDKSKDINYYVGDAGRLLANMAWQAEQFYEWVRDPDLTDFVIS
ncbi:MAG: flavin-containing monooxygenase, partial [Acidimicrobiia bacterium]